MMEELDNYYLLSDIPTEYYYKNREHKKEAMLTKIKKAGIKIHTIKGFRFILKSDYPKLMPYLTRPNLRNRQLKLANQKQGEKPAIHYLKWIFEPTTIDGVPIKEIAKKLGLSSHKIIFDRVKNGWTWADAISIPKGAFRNGRKRYYIKRKDTLKRRR